VNPAHIYVGIDVAKDRLDVAQRPGTGAWWVTNDDQGIADLVARLKALRPALVALEATGGIELPLVGALAVAKAAPWRSGGVNGYTWPAQARK